MTLTLEGYPVTLQKVKGVTFVELDGSYRLDLAVIPKTLVVVEPVFTISMQNYLQDQTHERLNEVQQVVVELQSLSPEELGRATFRKTVLINKGSINVLIQDQAFVLSKLDKAILRVSNPHPLLTIKPFLYRFSQKSVDSIDVEDICEVSNMECVSLHVGCTMSPKDPNSLYFWSRAGLEAMIGPGHSSIPACQCMSALTCKTCLYTHNVDAMPFLNNIGSLPVVTFWTVLRRNPICTPALLISPPCKWLNCDCRAVSSPISKGDVNQSRG